MFFYVLQGQVYFDTYNEKYFVIHEISILGYVTLIYYNSIVDTISSRLLNKRIQENIYLLEQVELQVTYNMNTNLNIMQHLDINKRRRGKSLK